MRHRTRQRLGHPLTLGGLALLLSLLFASSAVRSQQPPILPDPKLTPGATLPVTKDDICVPGYAKKVRNVPKAVKDQVYAEYGITSHRRSRGPPGSCCPERCIRTLFSREMAGEAAASPKKSQTALTRWQGISSGHGAFRASCAVVIGV